MLIVVLAALAAGACFASAGLLQQRAARTRTEDESLSPRLLGDLVRQPMWLGGITLAVLSYGFQALALANGPLSVVQPLIVMEVVFALPVAARLNHVHMGKRDWFGAVLVTGGLAGGLWAAAPSRGDPQCTRRAVAGRPARRRRPGGGSTAGRTSGEWPAAGLVLRGGRRGGDGHAVGAVRHHHQPPAAGLRPVVHRLADVPARRRQHRRSAAHPERVQQRPARGQHAGHRRDRAGHGGGHRRGPLRGEPGRRRSDGTCWPRSVPPWR